MVAEVRIVNVVATAKCEHQFDLNAIQRAFPEAEYRPERFPGLCFRLKKPKTGSLIFSSGSIVCTGAKSTAQARLAVRMVVKTLRNRGIIIPHNPEVHIQNIVGSANLGVDINMEKTAEALERTIYEPEQFPGIMYRMEEPKVNILIFVNGKLVITGAKSEEQVYQATVNIQRKLEEADVIFHREAPGADQLDLKK
ncbi:MAG: TATA-box-binding protein [Candidatus Bathyarchaeota archaeon]